MPRPVSLASRSAPPPLGARRRDFSARPTVAAVVTSAVAVLLVAVLTVAGCGGAGPTPSPTPSPTASPTASPTPVPTPEPTPATIEMIKAVDGGKVAVAGTGHGLQRLDLTLTSKSDGLLVVVINQGTVFDPVAERTQSMVVVARRMVDLEAGASVPVQLDVACADMKKDTPDRNDKFALREGSVPKDLVKLTRLPEFGEQSFRVQQFGVWTITDNPARTGYIGLGTADGASSGPTKVELTRIAELFRAAEVDMTPYRALKGL